MVHVPIILAEDKTKIKGCIAWDHCCNTLVGFYGTKKEHIYLSNYREVVGAEEELEYKKIVDTFHNNWIGSFARIVMVNPLHESLPWLVLVVTFTCNCFDALWVRQ